MECPKCASHNVLTDRNYEPAHTCADCGRAFDDHDVKHLTAPDTGGGFEEQIGEVLGWRAWYIHDRPEGARLQSLYYTGAIEDAVWEPGAVEVAHCCVREGHLSPASVEAATWPGAMPFEMQVPVESCTCGFYAAASKEQLLDLGYPRYDQDGGAAKCIGQVAMAGKVIPGTQGWRAQKMWPHKLYLPYEFWGFKKGLESAYQVPVELARTLFPRK